MRLDDYDPVESLREETQRFFKDNTFTPMHVTNFYVQAKCVLNELDQLREEIHRLRCLEDSYDTEEQVMSEVFLTLNKLCGT